MDEANKVLALTVERVVYMPETLEHGVLYVSDEFGVAIHLCACGCGMKTVTPTHSRGWKLSESSEGVTLSHSIGNWQIPCRSHYWIQNSQVIWC